MLFNALLAAQVAVLPDQIPVSQRGTISAVLGIWQPVASVTGTYLVQKFDGSTLAMFRASCAVGGFFVLSFVIDLDDRPLDPAHRPPWSLRELAGSCYVDRAATATPPLRSPAGSCWSWRRRSWSPTRRATC